MDIEAVKGRVLMVSNRTCESVTLVGDTLECIVPLELQAASEELEVKVKLCIALKHTHKHTHAHARTHTHTHTHTGSRGKVVIKNPNILEKGHSIANWCMLS